MKGFALRLVLNQRQERTRKWPIQAASTISTTSFPTQARVKALGKTLIKTEEFENAGFSFSCGRKTFGKPNFRENDWATTRLW